MDHNAEVSYHQTAPATAVNRQSLRMVTARTTRLIICLASLAGLSACQPGGKSALPVESAHAMSMPRIGAPAPAFSLFDHEAELRTLGDFEGRWVVLYFYPEAQTPACTLQADDFSRRAESFSALNAVVIGVSPDAPYEHQLFAARHDLNIILLSDPDGTVMRRYGAWRSARWRGQSAQRVHRSTFLINPNGRMAHVWPHVEPIGHADRVLLGLRHVQQASRSTLGPSE